MKSTLTLLLRAISVIATAGEAKREAIHNLRGCCMDCFGCVRNDGVTAIMRAVCDDSSPLMGLRWPPAHERVFNRGHEIFR